MKIHTEAYNTQRKFVERRKSESKQIFDTHTNRLDFFIGYYCQNLQIPHFGYEQPGKNCLFTIICILFLCFQLQQWETECLHLP